MRKVKNFWTKLGYLKQSLFIGLLTFFIVFIISIIFMLNTDSEMRGLALLIPFFPLIIVISGYKSLELPFIFSLIINLLAYYFIGMIITYIINKLIIDE